MKKIELLAPAGNLLKMKTAFFYGADAVYLGIPDFSLRVRINDFNLKTLQTGVEYAHKLKKKVYVTVNIFAHNQHFKKLPAYLKRLKELKVDALIISDPGIISLVKRVWPSAEIHLSTQANCTNLEAVKFWAKQGVKRIILGREVTLKEIKEIHRAVPKIELEYFIHGAMCMAYSGRCFLSKLFIGRSANLGDCAQPCRWEYDVKEYSLKTANHEEELELVEEKHGSYLLNSKDLCLVKEIRELAASGIVSFKIEGRAKSVYYQATVISIYARALNLLAKKMPIVKLNLELKYLYKELETKLVHRGYTTGFLLGEKADQNELNSHNKSAWEFCGQVIDCKNKKIRVQVHNTIKAGESVELIMPNYDIIKLRVDKIFDEKNGLEISEAHGGGGGQIISLILPEEISEIPALVVLRRLAA